METTPIRSSDPDAVERLDKRIREAVRCQEFMKRANVIVRSRPQNRLTEQKRLALKQIDPDLTDAAIENFFEPDFAGRVGFPGYKTRNNSQNINRMIHRRSKIKEEQAKPTTASTDTETRIKVQDDPPANRIRIFFPEKPDDQTRKELKRRGFRWSPRQKHTDEDTGQYYAGAWQAYRNCSSLRFAKQYQPTEPDPEPMETEDTEHQAEPLNLQISHLTTGAEISRTITDETTQETTEDSQEEPNDPEPDPTPAPTPTACLILDSSTVATSTNEEIGEMIAATVKKGKGYEIINHVPATITAPRRDTEPRDTETKDKPQLALF